jgi:hypothetical protein
MSIEIYAYLGGQTNNLEERAIHAFNEIGFEISFHPETNLLHTDPSGCIDICIHETPSNIPRAQENTPLIVSFGYSAAQKSESSKNEDEDEDEDEDVWLPPEAENYTYEIYTRTSAGRSHAEYFMQAYTVAILSKVTNGYFLFYDGINEAISGELAIKKITSEMNSLISRAVTNESFAGKIPSYFDEGVQPFTEWRKIGSSHYVSNNLELDYDRASLGDNANKKLTEKTWLSRLLRSTLILLSFFIAGVIIIVSITILSL